MNITETSINRTSLSIVLFSLFILLGYNWFTMFVAISSSIATAFTAIWILGYKLNLMMLLAISLITKILVDDAVVVLKKIQRHRNMGKEKRVTSLEGRREICFSALLIILKDIVVFLSILFLQFFAANMLIQSSLVIITAALISLLVVFTLTAWSAPHIGKKDALQTRSFSRRFLLWFAKQLESFTQSKNNLALEIIAS